MADSKPAARSHTNALIDESSPYLLQHAHNPVDWRPWGPEAFALARREGKPIFLSIGYSTCYWCHVMERQCFEDASIAARMNEHFVNIKVDREERPDVDDLYMLAVQMMTGSGGWPMSVFLTPPGAGGADDRGLRPFYAGTYFPPSDAYGRPGFPTVLHSIAEAWRTQRQQVLEQAQRVAAAMQRHMEARGEPADLDMDIVSAAASRLLRSYDEEHGGFGQAPKFPQPANLDFLLTVWCNNQDPKIRTALTHTLDRMARGGMYDHVGGGFHRYATDGHWLVPHFEKMLYDNGQLVELYARAHQHIPPADDPHAFARVVRQCCDYVLCEMTDASGAFWSAQDAEVDSREGLNYLWQPRQIRDALGDDRLASRAIRLYGLDDKPNFRDPHHPDEPMQYVLHLPAPLPDLAQTLGITLAQLLKDQQTINQRLRAARAKRKQPGTDDKVLVNWNGLMIAGLATAGRVLGEPRYIQAGRDAAQAILQHATAADGALLHTYRRGKARGPAFLEDYSHFVHGLIALQRAEPDGTTSPWLDHARRLMDQARQRFAAPDRPGGYFDTLADQEDLLVRTCSRHDGAVPSGASQMVHNLVDLFELTGEEAWLHQAAADLGASAAHLRREPTAMLHMQHALLRALEAAPRMHDPAGHPDARASSRRQAAALSIEDMQWSRDGRQLSARVVLDIHREYHVTAHSPGRDDMRGLAIELTPDARGQWALEVSYPAGIEREYRFGDGPVQVYEGRQPVVVALQKLTPDAAPPVLRVTYQLCTEQSCLEPRTVELALARDAT